MCLGVPGKVIEVNGLLATVDFWGVRKQIRLEVVDEPVQPGDYILNHVGYAIRRIPADEIDGTLALYEELLARDLSKVSSFDWIGVRMRPLRTHHASRQSREFGDLVRALRDFVGSHHKQSFRRNPLQHMPIPCRPAAEVVIKAGETILFQDSFFRRMH